MNRTLLICGVAILAACGAAPVERAHASPPADSADYVFCRNAGGESECFGFRSHCEGGVFRGADSRRGSCGPVDSEQCGGLTDLGKATLKRLARLPVSERPSQGGQGMICDGMSIKTPDGSAVACNPGKTQAALVILDAWEVIKNACKK